MATIHISQGEAAADFNAVVERVRSGEEVCIKDQSKTVAVVSAPIGAERALRLSEMIDYLKERGGNTLLDDAFGEDVEALLKGREQERLIDPWESS